PPITTLFPYTTLFRSVFRIVAVVLQPILHVGKAGHRRDLDALLEAEFLSGHRAVHAVRQPVVALFLGLDDRSGVHPRARAERVRSEEHTSELQSRGHL